MKNFLIVLISIIALASLHCSNETAGNCTSRPATDGRIYEFDSVCRVSAEEEHIRLEGVTVGSGQTVTVWARAADTSGNSGIRLEVDDTKITYANPDDTSNTFEADHGGLFDTTLCFDLHYEETPLHALAWKGSECDSSKEGSPGTVIFNREPSDGVTGNETVSSTKYLYQINRAFVAKIETKEPIFEE